MAMLVKNLLFADIIFSTSFFFKLEKIEKDGLFEMSKKAAKGK